MSTKRKRKCVWDSDAVECNSPAAGNPPLCAKHAKYRKKLQEQEEEQENVLIKSVLGALMDHPAVGGVFGRVNGILDNASGFVKDVANGKWPLGGVGPTPEAPPAPPPKASGLTSKEARELYGFKLTEKLEASKVKTRKRELATVFHPDKGYDQAMMVKINAAADVLLKECK